MGSNNRNILGFCQGLFGGYPRHFLSRFEETPLSDQAYYRSFQDRIDMYRRAESPHNIWGGGLGLKTISGNAVRAITPTWLKALTAFPSIVFFLFIITNTVCAQVDSLSTDVDQVIEDAVSNSDVDEQVDFSFITDALNDLQENPLNLNTATREELLIIPGMNDLLVNNLFSHIQEFGVLTSVYELQAIEGFTQEITSQLLPYVSVKESTAKDISPGSLHPAGPGFDEVWGGLKTEFTQRAVFLLEEQKGYTPPDTTLRPIIKDGIQVGNDTSLSSRYVGSPVQVYTRLRARYNQNFSFGITAEKDRGEEFRWDPSQQYFGYDYTSAHISLKDYGNLKNLVIGDYTLQFGQGLIYSRGLGFGKGAETINATKMPGHGIRPYSSVNENQFLRGAAVTYAIDKIYITAFGSRVRLDASIQERDTLTDQVELVGSIQTSGLHRTESELNNRKATAETAIGGRVEYRTRTLRIGTSHYFQKFDSEINRAPNAYNQFDFQGDQNYLNGLDFDWIFQNFNFFGEVARSKSGGFGATVGFMSSLSKTLDLAVVARSFDKDFHTTKGYAFAERPTAIQNEKGLYLGVKVKPHDKWLISGYFDQFYFPWNRFGASFPSKGHEYMAQIEFKPRRGTQVYVRFRSDNKEENASESYPGQQLDFLVPTQKLQLRLHFRTSIERTLSLRTRVEFARFTKGEEKAFNGFMAYQDVIWKFGFKWKLTGRYALFDIPDSDVRIYAYENDVLGFFSIPPYNGVGSRYYLMLNYKVVKGVEFWARFAQTRLMDSKTFGSGLEEIQGTTRSEVKLQVRFMF